MCRGLARVCCQVQGSLGSGKFDVMYALAELDIKIMRSCDACTAGRCCRVPANKFFEIRGLHQRTAPSPLRFYSGLWLWDNGSEESKR